jgi:hypothetical protein
MMDDEKPPDPQTDTGYLLISLAETLDESRRLREDLKLGRTHGDPAELEATAARPLSRRD